VVRGGRREDRGERREEGGGRRAQDAPPDRLCKPGFKPVA